MQLTWLVLAVCASLCSGGEKKNPGLVVVYFEKTMDMLHQEVILGKHLEGKLNCTNIPPICGNLSTLFWSKFDFNLTDIKLASYKSPKAKVNITTADGIVLDILVPMMEFVGRHDIRYGIGPWDQYTWNGNFTIRITETKLNMKRDIILIEKEKMKLESSNLSGSIKDVDIQFDDPLLTKMFSLTDTLELKKLLLDHLFEACKNLTEHEIDYSYKLTDELCLDMTLVCAPVMHDGDVEFFHKGEVLFKGDNRRFVGEPRALDLFHPNKTMLYRFTDFIFNSLGFVVFNHNLLTYKFTKADLPENNKELLETTCKKDCFGKLFPKSEDQFPGSSIEIDVSTASAPYVTITPESFNFVLEFKYVAKARKGNGPPKDVFNLFICLAVLVHPSVKDTKLRFSLELLNSNVTVVDSKIGELPKENLLTIIELSFEKHLTPIIENLNTKGLDLKLPELFHVRDYDWKFEKQEATLMMVFNDINYVNLGNSSVRDLDSRGKLCDE